MVARKVALFVVGLLLAAACGDKTQPVEGPNGLPPPLDAGTTVPGSPPTTSGPGATPDTTSPTAPRGSSSPSGSPSPRPTPAPGKDPIAAAAKGSVGSFARVLLRPAPAERLVIDLMTEAGLVPSSNTLAEAVDTLQDVTGKPVSLTRTTVTGGQEKWTGSELNALADSKAPTPQGGNTAAIRVLFVRGGLEGNDAAVGVAVRGDVLAVFADRVDESASPLVSRSRMEHAVLVHELGHLMGLVDLALDTNREDPDHPGHSRNSGSVMYWAVESTLVGQALSGPPPTEFDDQDTADLAKMRGGA